ncbi:MAG: glycosyltransferase family 2 protein [Lachnospiraceae bacterium]|nr:glycosyltransferase family 2 protein [Lachnospiraceae bacterium]
MNKKVAALVILYHYTLDNINDIRTYACQVEKVYCFDNTENIDKILKEKLEQIENVEYYSQSENIGLTIAINRIAKIAIKEGYNWLFTFDQDSRASENMVQKMVHFIDEYEEAENVGIIAPVVSDGKVEFGIPVSRYSFYDRVIQSGAMHNLNVLQDIGGYDEKLFIDQVDLEYCIRLIQNGYKIIRLSDAVLLHNSEDENTYVRYVNGKKLTINKYSPIRYYYIIRNNLYCGKIYKNVFRPYYAETKRNIEMRWKTIPYEKQKIKKIKAIMCGYLDFLLSRMGKCKWHL